MALTGALLLASCGPVMGTVDGPIRFGVLTADGGVTFHHAGDGQDVTVSTDVSSPNGDVREVFWPKDSNLWTADQQDCMTWTTTALSSSGLDLTDLTSQNLPAQPGLAMRIAPSADGRGVRAVTVTENVYSWGLWYFNVHVWDSTNTVDPYQLVGQFDLTSVVGDVELSDGVATSTMAPPPWHVCARTAGDQFSFMVWTGDEPQPAWGDPSRTFTVTLPTGWDYPGYAGGFAGHLHAGQSLGFTGWAIEPLCLAADAQDLPVCQTEASTDSSTTVAAPTTTMALP